MPRKHTGFTGPFERLLTDEEIELTRKQREESKRAYQRGDRYRDKRALQGRPEGPPSDYAEPMTDSHPPSVPSRIHQRLIQGDPWRLWTGFAVLVLLLLQGAEHGVIRGFDARASAASVAQLHAEYMEGELMEAQWSWCLGTSAQTKTFYGKRVSELVTRYRDVMGRYPESVSCKLLGVPEYLVTDP